MSNVLDVLGAVDNSVFRRAFPGCRWKTGRRTVFMKLEEMVIQGRELSQFVRGFYLVFDGIFCILKTADERGRPS